MKIVHLIGGGDVGGAKTHILYLLGELSKHVEVKLICLRPGANADEARALGIDVTVIKSKNIFNDIRAVRKLICEGKYNIMHSHGAKANFFALAARHKSGIPTVTTVHSDYRLDYMHSLARRMTIGLTNSIALHFMNNYIAVSENFKKMLLSRGFKFQDIYVLYNGIDFSVPTVEYSRESLINKYNLNINEDDVIVGIAARLYPVKSIDTIIKAAKIIKEKTTKVKFIIAGDGEDRKQLEALSTSLGLTDTVFFPGWLDDPNELMSSIDISVLTSISESFSYSILEGARFRKATISSRVGGIPDLIESGRNGYLFEPGDYKHFAELIMELAENKEKRITMGVKLYQKALANFSVEAMGRTQLDIYRKILKKRAEALSNPGGKEYDAIIHGYYGFRNIGDDALLMSIIKDLKEFKPDIRLLVLSRNPSITTCDFQIDAIGRFDMLRIYRVMRKSKAFIYGGGNLLQDNTSTRSLFFYLSTVWLAKMLKLKVMFYANGIGPLKKKLSRFLTKKIINRVDIITLREGMSFKELKSMDISNPRILLTADAALSVAEGSEACTSSEASDTDILSLLGIPTDKPLLGISLRKYPGHEKFEHEKYESAIARVADHMVEEYGAYPVFIPMQYPDDIPILKNAAARMNHSSNIVRVKLNVLQTYELVSKMHVMLGMRLHALIFSAVNAVPMVGLVYDPKIQGFLDCINQPSAGDVRQLDYNNLLKLTEQVWKEHDELSRQLITKIPALQEKARENAKVAVELIDSYGE